jgi:hypothetical protein
VACLETRDPRSTTPPGLFEANLRPDLALSSLSGAGARRFAAKDFVEERVRQGPMHPALARSLKPFHVRSEAGQHVRESRIGPGSPPSFFTDWLKETSWACD